MNKRCISCGHDFKGYCRHCHNPVFGKGSAFTPAEIARAKSARNRDEAGHRSLYRQSGPWAFMLPSPVAGTWAGLMSHG